MGNESNHPKSPKSLKPGPPEPRHLVGMGLISLDVVAKRDHSTPSKLYAGGTCGNVMAILAFLGWKSVPVARMDDGPVSAHVLRDLHRFGVKSDFMHLKPQSPAPVIVEWLSRDRDGNGTHRYSFTCSECGGWYPGYRPVVAKAASEVLPQLGTPAVFFFDRVSRSALDLATEFAEAGAVIVFEPSAIGDPKQFRQAVELCHILKYSSDRLSDLGTLSRRPTPPLEISTLGAGGLVYRSKLGNSKSRTWHKVAPIPVAKVVDAAGSGDWFTAVLLDATCQSGASALKKLSAPALQRAIHKAEAAAAWNCAFEGPRGGMYSTTPEALHAAISSLLLGQDFARAASATLSTQPDNTLPPDVCLLCSPIPGAVRSPRPARV